MYYECKWSACNIDLLCLYSTGTPVSIYISPSVYIHLMLTDQQWFDRLWSTDQITSLMLAGSSIDKLRVSRSKDTKLVPTSAVSSTWGELQKKHTNLLQSHLPIHWYQTGWAEYWTFSFQRSFQNQSKAVLITKLLFLCIWYCTFQLLLVYTWTCSLRGVLKLQY